MDAYRGVFRVVIFRSILENSYIMMNIKLLMTILLTVMWVPERREISGIIYL